MLAEVWERIVAADEGGCVRVLCMLGVLGDFGVMELDLGVEAPEATRFRRLFTLRGPVDLCRPGESAILGSW